MNGRAWPELFAPPARPALARWKSTRSRGTKSATLHAHLIEYPRDNACVYAPRVRREYRGARAHTRPNDIRTARRRKSELEEGYFLVLPSYRKSAAKKGGKNEAALLLLDFRYRSPSTARSIYSTKPNISQSITLKHIHISLIYRENRLTLPPSARLISRAFYVY